MKIYSYNEFIKSLRDYHKTPYNQHLIPYYSNYIPQLETAIEFIKSHYPEDIEDDKSKFCISVDKKYVYFYFYKTFNLFTPQFFTTSINEKLRIKIFINNSPLLLFHNNTSCEFNIITSSLHKNLSNEEQSILVINDYREFFLKHFDNTFLSLIDKEVYKFISKYQKYKIFGPSYIDDLLLFQ